MLSVDALCRLTIDRLENEKKELLHELQTLRKHANPSAGGPNDVVSHFYLLFYFATHTSLSAAAVEDICMI